MKQFVLPLLIISLFIECRNPEFIPAQCEVLTINQGGRDKHTYVYDSQGRAVTMARAIDEAGNGSVKQYFYKFIYDSAGKLTSSSWTLNGQPDGSEQYAYTGNQITKISYTLANGQKGVHNLKYTAAGLISEFTFESGNPNTDGKQYTEYDANGIITKTGFSDLKGTKYVEEIRKAVGMVKSPEQLLINSGLPFDMRTGRSWETARGSVGSTYEGFLPNPSDGHLESVYTGKTTVATVNNHGYLTETTFAVDKTTKATTIVYTFLDCN